ncbi:hypothetical protein NPIL_496971 [Nephila pilipes]|uniref:Uncharacterized protein n=1 Tax=Nephila pilipes TaxID=299642 RepID=A0A8X6NIG7_NEPPI|nr:hypothetical protein NPIL_496971 [Nephila pilipes]
MIFFSGFLVSYVIFKKFAKSNEDKVQFPWLSFYIHRYIRLTPVYMIVLGFYTTLMASLGSGPLWILKDDPNCIANWWWNALYINNFQSADDQRTRNSCNGSTATILGGQVVEKQGPFLYSVIRTANTASRDNHRGLLPSC